MSKNFGQYGNSKNGVISINMVQGQMGQKSGFNQNFDSQSQLQEDSSELYNNRIDTLHQIDENNINMGQLRMDTSLSHLQQNYAANKTQNTQQGSSKGNIHSSTYLPYDSLTSEQLRKGEYQRGQSNPIRKNSNSNRNKYSGTNYSTQGRNDHRIKKGMHNSSFYSQSSQEAQNQDKFGFVKAETIYGSGKCDGLLNSDLYISSLQTYLKDRHDKKKGGSSLNHTVLDRMQEHIEYTNELQRRFIEQSMNSIDAAAHERFLKYENNEQSILNKLNQHILYTKDRDHINQLTKAEQMKNSFIPNKLEEEADLTVRPKINIQKVDNNTTSKQGHQSPSTKAKMDKSPRGDLEGKVDTPKLIHVHKDSNNNIINKIVDKQVLKIQSSKTSSQRNSLQTSPRQPPQLSIPKQSGYRDSASPQRRPISKVESNNDEGEIFLDNLRSHRTPTAAVEEKKAVPFLKQPTMKEVQQQEQIDEKKMLEKNKKVLKNKIEKIVSKHQKVIKDIDYAYQEVTEQIKKKELLKRMRSMSDANTPNNFSFTGNTPNQHLQFKEQVQNLQGKNNFQRLGKIVMNKINNTGFSQVINHAIINNQSANIQQRNSVTQYNSAINPNLINTPVSQGGQVSALQSLEFQKKQLLENIQNTQNENKIYFQAKYKIREKGLNFDLSNSNNKEQVLDRVLMNYFHQQDLLNEQENLLKKAYKSGRSASRGKSYKTKELGSLLSKFQPKHMRLHLKDITKGVSGGTMASMQQNQGSRQHRSVTAQPGSRKPSLFDKIEEQSSAYKDFQDEENVDVNVYKDKFEWKKKQNKIINYSKVCSPAEMVLQFMKQDPRYKKQQNIEAIDFLVQFDPKKAKEEEDMEGKEADSTENQEKNRKRFDDAIMRRCFFFYSNKNDANTSERFQEVTLQKFLTLFYNLSGQEYDESLDQDSHTPFPSQNNVFQEPERNEISFFGHILKHKLHLNLKGDLNNRTKDQNNSNNNLNSSASPSKILVLGDNHIEIQTLKTIFEKITSKKEKHVLNYYEFLEAIRKTSVQYYLKKISQDQIPQPQELFERFFVEFIKPQHMNFRDPEEQELLKMREYKQIDSLLKLFEDNLKDLFVFAGSMRSQTTYDFSQIYLGFQEMYEILQKLDFFPNKISKTTIRYIYYYTLSLDQGLDFQDFCQCLHLIGLRIIRYPLKNVPITLTLQEIYNLQRKCREIQYTIFKLKQEAIFNQSIQKFIQDISLFYVHKDYIDYQKIQQKIIDIKESNQKQLQMM